MIYITKIPPKYDHLYRKIRIDHLRINKKLTSTFVTLGFYQILINWRKAIFKPEGAIYMCLLVLGVAGQYRS